MHYHFKSSFTYMVSVDIMCLPNSTARNWIRPPTLASDIPNSNGTLVTFSIFGKSNYPASTTLMVWAAPDQWTPGPAAMASALALGSPHLAGVWDLSESTANVIISNSPDQVNALKKVGT